MAESLIHNQVYVATGAPFKAQQLYRLVWCAADSNKVVLIRIVQTHHTRQAPMIESRHSLGAWIDSGILKLVELRPASEALLSDEELNARARQNRPGGSGRNKKEKDDCDKVAFRKYWWTILEPVTRQLESVWQGRTTLGALIKKRAEETRNSEQLIYLHLYRYLANGATRLGIFSDQGRTRGGRGKKRTGRGSRLGRPTLSQQMIGEINGNFPLDDRCIEGIQAFWKKHIKMNAEVSAAYGQYLDTYWTDHYESSHGRIRARHYPPGQRPSLMQFRTHGPQSDPEQVASRKLAGEIAWQMNCRALTGHRDPQTFRTGLWAQVDASSGDVYLCSVENRSVVVGPARVLPVVDIPTGYIAGFYVGWRVNETAARLAMLNAASPKKDFCARAGVEIEEEDWIPILHEHYDADRGEFNCDEVFRTFEQLSTSLSIMRSFRGDDKGVVEKVHDLLHLHDLPGSTHGKRRQRGEPDPARSAALNIIEFTRLLIERILFHNNVQIVEHFLTSEMRRDGVKPTRIEILKWSMRNGYHHSHAVHPDALITALCPECDAVVTGSGIYLTGLRHDTHGDEIVLDRLRYLGDFAIRQRWLEMGRKKRFRLRVYYNPNCLDTISYLDDREGLQHFDLAANDPLFRKIACYQDILCVDAHQKVELAPLREEERQARAGLTAAHKADAHEAQSELRDALPFSSKQRQPNDAKGRKVNLANEISRTGISPIPVPAHHPTLANEPAVEIPLESNESPLDPGMSISSEDDAIQQWIRRRTAKS